jgi:hypothetical protein
METPSTYADYFFSDSQDFDRHIHAIPEERIGF